MSDTGGPAPEESSEGAPQGGTALHRSGRSSLFLFFAIIGVISLCLMVIAGVAIGVYHYKGEAKVEKKQEELAPFYVPPATFDQTPGAILRQEEMTDVEVPGGKGFRILYTSKNLQGNPVVVSGMIFVPDQAAPAGGRKVIGWAHGTVGLAPQCAPSRGKNQLADTQGWLNLAMRNNWVVTATDYQGLGTPGPKTYLIGETEAQDVVNSVRAAHNLATADVSKDWIVYGHSQGGHAALWTGELAKTIAPELNLMAVGAAAPATELMVIIQHQWASTIGWVIGPEAAESFTENYPGKTFLSGLSQAGKDQLDNLESECTLGGGLTGLTEEEFGNGFFTTNPLLNPDWVEIAKAQTPKPLPASMPLFMASGTNDQIVLSGSNALMQVEWCAAGSAMDVAWLGTVGHLPIANDIGPVFIEWASNRFDKKPIVRNCTYPPAFEPYPPVTFPLTPQELATPAPTSFVTPTESSKPSS